MVGFICVLDTRIKAIQQYSYYSEKNLCNVMSLLTGLQHRALQHYWKNLFEDVEEMPAQANGLFELA